jgi:hypothetical protein
MPRFVPRVQAVLAEQFNGTRASAQAIGALPGIQLRATTDGLFVLIERRWAYLNADSWVVRSRAGIEILTDEEFQILYEVEP